MNTTTKPKRKSRFATALALIKRNWVPLLVFELIYKIVSNLILVPLLSKCFQLIMEATGFSYITLENVFSFATRPLTIILILILVLIMGTLAMIDIGAIIYVLDQSRAGEKAHIRGMAIFTVKNALRVWEPGNFLILLIVLVLMPFLNLGTSSGLITSINIPEFIMDYIEANNLLFAAFILLVALLLLLMTRWTYTFHYFTLEHLSFRQAHRSSYALSQKHLFGDFATIIGVQGIYYLAYLGVMLLAGAVSVGAAQLFKSIPFLKWFSTGIASLIGIVAVSIGQILSAPVSYGLISALYYSRKEAAGEVIEPLQPVPVKKATHHMRVTAVIVTCLVLAAGIGLGYTLCSGSINPLIEYVHEPVITAHRGSSAYYPENTMSGFRGAVEMGAGMAELDVQQTKDHQIVVMHDSNTRRTTGVRGNVWEMTYDEIAQLDAGSFFSKDYAGEHIPLLSEVIEYAKSAGLKLQIEIKCNGHEEGFEKDVVDLINAYEFKDMCVVISQQYDVLKKVKEYDPEIRTVYVMSLAIGNLLKFTYADDFSLEASNINEGLVTTLHNAGKQVYAWTVNSETAIDDMIDLNVDNLVTDNVPLAKECVAESHTGGIVGWFIKQLQ